MNTYVISIQVPDILVQMFEKIDNKEEKEGIKEILDLLEDFENESEYADLFLVGELMLGFEAPSEKSAINLYKFIKKILKKQTKRYGIGFELLMVLDDRSMKSIVNDKS